MGSVYANGTADESNIIWLINNGLGNHENTNGSPLLILYSHVYLSFSLYKIKKTEIEMEKQRNYESRRGKKKKKDDEMKNREKLNFTF